MEIEVFLKMIANPLFLTVLETLSQANKEIVFV